MLDAAARSSAAQGANQRLEAVISELRDDPIKAEIVVVLCAAVAHADGTVTEEEQKLFDRLAAGLGLGENRALEILSQLETRFDS
jgi:tellurite resistance protein